ncbi:putative acid phosphatase-like protein [Rosellinia necatrix]|uniref:Putative acid phosphatase-like protein n=1 Tax=Rosellinia necatrix TaxID=77044 RepID=A0A1S7UI69_ROSNE|nr:putative acid phosphatase-like protein [Rosellinia necatrix]
MKALSGMFNAWSHCIFQICHPTASQLDEKSHGHDDLNDNSFAIIHDEPSFMPRPSAAPLRNAPDVFGEERTPRKRRGSGWSSFSVRKRLLPSDTSLPRRPRISPPSNFRHVYSESFHFPDSTSSQFQLQSTSFRPLELGLNMSDTRLSPILPHLNYSTPPITPPPRVYTLSNASDSGSHAISHKRSHSSVSFNIPRRPVNGGSISEIPRSNTSTPQRPPPARARGYVSPSPAPPPIMEDLVERVANAMLERDKLQEQIDDIVERQTLCSNSRPSTAHGQPEMEPMPEVPAMPPNAPSFSERLSSDHIPSTVTTTQPPSARTARYEANSSRKIEGRVPPPPLPLRLRPPLRKKKSFSRVSNWLNPAGAAGTAATRHKRDVSYDSITNAPAPVTGRKGFYQVAVCSPEQPNRRRRSSFDSASVVSDWTVEEEEEETTLITSLSPSNATTPRAIVGQSPPSTARVPLGLEEPIQFQHRTSVGIAF